MAHYTNIEQSKKLLELGLNPKTADMVHPCSIVHNKEIGSQRQFLKNLHYILFIPILDLCEEQIRRLEYFLKLWSKTEDTENTKVFEIIKLLLNDLKQL